MKYCTNYELSADKKYLLITYNYSAVNIFVVIKNELCIGMSLDFKQNIVFKPYNVSLLLEKLAV